MKRYFKKIILIFMIIIIVTPNFAKVVLASKNEEETKSKRSNFSDVIDSYSKDSYGALADEGKADIKESSDDQSGDLSTRTQTTLAPKTMSLPSAANVVCSVLNLILRTTQAIVTIIFVDREDDTSTMSFFTIYDLLAGKYAIFNANFMDFEPVGKSDGINIIYVFNSGKEVNNAFKTIVSQWFQILKNLSYILALCVLIYVGIRMAISTVASEQAKYKKMLIDWVAGIFVIIIMPYIISVASFVSDALINIFASFLETNDNFENTMVEEIAFNLPHQVGWSALIITLEYLALVFIQIRFALMYVKRFLALGFLIMIGPLVTVTYAIDSVGDGKAQAFNNWLKELFRNLFVQPLHLIIYLVFLGSAGEIFENFHLLGIIFLLSLTRIEKILLKLFSMSGSLTVGTLQDQKISKNGIL